MNILKQVKYETIEDALTDLNAQDKGRYFLCLCPECEQQEAFIYKNNPSYIICNRENQCGERMILQFREEKNIDEFKQRQEDIKYPTLTSLQQKSLEWTKHLFQHFQRNFDSKALDNGYRGISPDVSKKFIVDLKDEKIVKLLFEQTESLLSKAYSTNSWMCKRNLVIPIYGDNDSLDRILLRSSIEPDINPKEIQLIMNPSKDTRDFFVDIPKNVETIVISESIIDALSFREIDRSIGIIALTGATKTRQLIEYLNKNKRDFKNKKILLAMDDDRAGHKATNKLLNVIEKQKISKVYTTFDFGSSTVKDANEFLQLNRSEFKRKYKKALYTLAKQFNKKKLYDFER